MKGLPTPQEAVKDFEQRYPGLAAQVRIGTVQVQTPSCHQCGGFQTFSPDEIVFDLVEDEDAPQFGLIPFDEYSDKFFCSQACRIAFAKSHELQVGRCDSCGKEFIKHNYEDEYGGMYYMSAWDDDGVKKVFCSDSCRDSYGESFFMCEWCYREVIDSIGLNPHGKWISECEIVCLKCYKEDIFANGLPYEDFEAHKISGMFFRGDNQDVVDAGFSAVPKFSDYFLDDERPEPVKEYCDYAMRLINRGFIVVTGYENLSTMGGEGWVTMFVKKVYCTLSDERTKQ
jgi:hypothetical protein